MQVVQKLAEAIARELPMLLGQPPPAPTETKLSDGGSLG
jgi:hypothetical protein